MNKIMYFILVTSIALVFSACKPSGPPPAKTSVLKLAKTASSQTYRQVGQSITYTYVITNTGTTSLGPAPFTISDNKLGASLNCGPANTVLAPDQNLTCMAVYTITQADMSLGNLTNSATASGGGQTSEPATVTILNLAAGATQAPPAGTPGGTAPVPTATAIRISFVAGQTTATLTGLIHPNETIRYVVNAAHGRLLSIKLTAATNEVQIGVKDPTGGVLKALDASSIWSTTITTDGDYDIDIANGQGGSSQSYTLEVGLSAG